MVWLNHQPALRTSMDWRADCWQLLNHGHVPQHPVTSRAEIGEDLVNSWCPQCETVKPGCEQI